MHWRTEGRLVSYWRSLAGTLARAQQMPRCERIRVSAVIYRERSREADESGDAERLKPLIDGLKDAGVIVDDSYRYVEHSDITPVTAAISGIELIVEELEPLPAPRGSGSE